MASNENQKPGDSGLCWLVATVLLAIVRKVGSLVAAAILLICLLYAINRMG
ncbi:hypothetical protein [Bifidobacterium sp. ESL0732]|uniref:hypothetical protein n=1 Tax=Bifidobacterium sp. ESL0732 TaxID=2983222 RepID=UPI0023F9C56A|nr:hypothetical protein [Bifidobacterium sp. ESL0732]WEV63713.1 hypothetical protein OZX70_07175 [Bifidobacterium sp. ESL0732]